MTDSLLAVTAPAPPRGLALRRVLEAAYRALARGAGVRLAAHDLRDLSRLNEMGIEFITLRRRDAKMLRCSNRSIASRSRLGGASSSRASSVRTGHRGCWISRFAFATMK